MKNLISNVLVVVMLFVLVGVSFLSSAEGLNTASEKKLIEISEVDSLDADREIITKIDGMCYDIEIHSRNGLFLDVTFSAGSWGAWFDIKGWKYPFLTFYHELVTHAHVSCFFGFFREHDYGNHYIYDIRGFAFGDIEWS